MPSSIYSVTVIYYYCDYSDIPSLSASSIIFLLLKQLLQRLSSDRFTDDLQLNIDEVEMIPPLTRAIACRRQRLLEISTPVIIVDGLDQLDAGNPDSTSSLLKTLLSEHNSLKILATSRSETIVIKEYFTAFPKLYLKGSAMDKDIAIYVNHKLGELHHAHPIMKNERLKQEVVHVLQEGAQGM